MLVRKNYMLEVGEATDVVTEAQGAPTLREAVGVDFYPVLAERGAMVTADGRDLCNMLPLQAAPAEGATGEENDGDPDYDPHRDSERNTLMTVMMSIPGLQGNVFSHWHNGNSELSGDGNGEQGLCVGVVQELWPTVHAGANLDNLTVLELASQFAVTYDVVD